MDLSRLDVEGVGVLEDGGVALEAEDEAVEVLAGNGRVNVPGEGLGAVLDTGCLGSVSD